MPLSCTLAVHIMVMSSIEAAPDALYPGRFSAFCPTAVHGFPSPLLSKWVWFNTMHNAAEILFTHASPHSYYFLHKLPRKLSKVQRTHILIGHLHIYSKCIHLKTFHLQYPCSYAAWKPQSMSTHGKHSFLT